MMRCRLFLGGLAILNGFLTLADAATRLPVNAPAASDRPPDATIPWITVGDPSWAQGAPLFRVGGTNDPSAAGWVTASDEAILIKVVVRDHQHVNRRTDGAIWDGDCIQLGVDIAGAGVPGPNQNDVYVGPHDASITFALTEQGAKAWAHAHGRPGGVGAMPQLVPEIQRDEAAGTTTYNLQLPWSEFQAQAGIWPDLGLAFQINDTDDGEPKQKRIAWGEGGAGQLRPGLFKRLRLGAPPHEVIAARITRSEVYQESDFAEVTVAYHSGKILRAHVVVGDQSHEVQLQKPDATNLFSRSVIRLWPGALSEGATPLEVGIVDVTTSQRVANADAVLTDASQTVYQLAKRLRQLQAAATESLMIRHYASMEAQLGAEWNSALQVTEENPQPARECVDYAVSILNRLNTADFPWELYADGQRDLVFGFRASSDNTRQFYLLRLPRAWDPEKAYPVIIFLHGTGNPHPLAFIAGTLGEMLPEDAGREYIRVMPWGRGNKGYEGYAGQDVYDSLDDCRRRVLTDENRTYLTGFSMGGGGTWALGLTRPDLWAALAICAGGTWYMPPGSGLGANLANTPVIIWHGDSDGAVPVTEAYAMQRELQAGGNEPEMLIVPGLGHQIAPGVVEDIAQRLLQHRRQKPSAFSYSAASRLHRSAYGITMDWPSVVTPGLLPRVDVKISGQQVDVQATGTPKIRMALGVDGFGLAGDVNVSLNGKPAYKGPAETVTFTVDQKDP